MKNKNNQGYIALITALLISGLLAAIATSASLAGFITSDNLLNREFKLQSYELARSCAEMAIVKILLDPVYQPAVAGDTIILVNNPCAILKIIKASNVYTLTTSATDHRAVTNLITDFDTTNLKITKITETN